MEVLLLADQPHPLTTTLVFAAATAACLGVLAGAALRIDLASRWAAVASRSWG